MESQIKETNEIFADNLLRLALDVGEGMLKNGAEINRVEDTIERICKAYGANHVEVFSIISVIHAAIRMPDGTYSSQMRRVKTTSTDFGVLEELNALSRNICKNQPTLEEFDEMIHDIKKRKTYPFWMLIIASAMATGAFALFFGGSVKDALVAALIGSLVAVIDKYASKRLNSMAKTLVSSFVAAMLAVLSTRIGLGDNSGIIIIGVIMILVPGISFVTALRDLLCGDLLTGSLKTVQACLGALMIAFGYLFAMTLLGGGAA